ncbi:hypothetical protein IKG31_00800 [Candidatus Saccharibacteria bacterium]|nr:hypothetical protein [Candidatus Saccharibacteria bacterium]
MTTNQNYNHGSRPTSGMSNMDYLNSISTSPRPTSSRSNSTSSSSKKGLLAFMTTSVALIIVLITAIVVVISDRGDHEAPEEPGSADIVTAEDHKQVEVLNKTLAELIEDDPHRDYISQNEQSYYYGSAPSEIIDEFSINIDDLNYSSADGVPAMNSNILNYYLDQEAIVIIVDPVEITVQEDKKTDTLIVYASLPSEYDFVGFIPSDFNADGSRKDDWLFPEQMAIYLSRSELFNQLSESTKFYVIYK